MSSEGEITEKLLQRRRARREAASRRGSHPVAHIDPDKVHEWMRAECAVLSAARQAREDKLMDVVIQTSSAALLAIPGFLVASGKGLPSLGHSWLLSVGAAAFALAFASGCVEQVLSGKAYRAQRLVVQKYYTQTDTRTEDRAAIRRADWARTVALIIFTIAVSLGALGLLQVARDTNGYAAPASAATSTSTSTSTSASTSASASASPASRAATDAGSALRRRGRSEVEPRPNHSAANQKVTTR